MKILFVVRERRKIGCGGVEAFMLNLSKELRKKGHKIEILSRNDDLNIKNTLKSIFPLRKRIKKEVSIKDYDIIYTQDWNLALPLLFPSPLFNKKHFCFFHGTQYGVGFFIQLLVGLFMGKKLCTGDRLNKKRFYKSTLLATSVDLNKFKPLHKKRIYLGWTNKPSEDITKEQIKKIGKKLKIPVLIAEDITHEKMNEFYNKCKIFISLPPKYAGGSLTCMEAMGSGVPRIIGNKYGEGYKYPFEKIEDFDNIEQAIKKSKKRNYRKWMKNSKITWEDHAEKLIKIFGKNKEIKRNNVKE